MSTWEPAYRSPATPESVSVETPPMAALTAFHEPSAEHRDRSVAARTRCSSG
ncbi:hypothetical protein WME94_08085 [Sorangium sp. So ce429]